MMDGPNTLVPGTGRSSLQHLVGTKLFVAVSSIPARMTDQCLKMHCSDSCPLSLLSLFWLVMVALVKQHL